MRECDFAKGKCILLFEAAVQGKSVGNDVREAFYGIGRRQGHAMDNPGRSDKIFGQLLGSDPYYALTPQISRARLWRVGWICLVRRKYKLSNQNHAHN
ncbi:MAG: hypothetical protein WGN25_04330 [Candidatus Electrothrix sp. GW3-4]|uniref:hypothetical protein n=1 Tax=Candidatus Electrothrix sp. GW3-4 TaxID=3126740 RepID=UPI0030D3B8D9